VNILFFKAEQFKFIKIKIESYISQIKMLPNEFITAYNTSNNKSNFLKVDSKSKAITYFNKDADKYEPLYINVYNLPLAYNITEYGKALTFDGKSYEHKKVLLSYYATQSFTTKNGIKQDLPACLSLIDQLLAVDITSYNPIIRTQKTSIVNFKTVVTPIEMAKRTWKFNLIVKSKDKETGKPLDKPIILTEIKDVHNTASKSNKRLMYEGKPIDISNIHLAIKAGMCVSARLMFQISSAKNEFYASISTFEIYVDQSTIRSRSSLDENELLDEATEPVEPVETTEHSEFA
jgi:hypothetical protein